VSRRELQAHPAEDLSCTHVRRIPITTTIPFAEDDAILLVDPAGRLRAEGQGLHDALAGAGRWLRPIPMTTPTTIPALMPLALGVGEGEGAKAPLARAVVGGPWPRR
jgi:multidrug efflux pump subunit AcrB